MLASVLILVAVLLLVLWRRAKRRNDDDIDNGDAPAVLVETSRPHVPTMGFHRPVTA